jgi:hypothetical protein
LSLRGSVKYNVTSTVWLYTVSYPGQLYFLFLSCLSLFSSAISHCIVISSDFTSLLHTFEYTVFCSIFLSAFSLCFTIYHNKQDTKKNTTRVAMVSASVHFICKNHPPPIQIPGYRPQRLRTRVMHKSSILRTQVTEE